MTGLPAPGWDNRTFRLGDTLLVRLPSGAAYAGQVEKEQRWLRRLAPMLPLPIPQPMALGEPDEGYPWHWSVYRWLDGEPASVAQVTDRRALAIDLAAFLKALWRIDASEGPTFGAHNFFRGGPLATYDSEARRAIEALRGRIDAAKALEMWECAAATTWRHAPMWVHGDMSAGNLLVREGRLGAVIDFGMLGTGDPACDLAIAWTFLEGENRDAFRAATGLDAQTWQRGRAWALWKAAIVAAEMCATNELENAQCWRTLDQVLGSVDDD